MQLKSSRWRGFGSQPVSGLSVFAADELSGCPFVDRCRCQATGHGLTMFAPAWLGHGRQPQSLVGWSVITTQRKRPANAHEINHHRYVARCLTACAAYQAAGPARGLRRRRPRASRCPGLIAGALASAFTTDSTRSTPGQWPHRRVNDAGRWKSAAVLPPTTAASRSSYEGFMSYGWCNPRTMAVIPGVWIHR